MTSPHWDITMYGPHTINTVGSRHSGYCGTHAARGGSVEVGTRRRVAIHRSTNRPPAAPAGRVGSRARGSAIPDTHRISRTRTLTLHGEWSETQIYYGRAVHVSTVRSCFGFGILEAQCTPPAPVTAHSVCTAAHGTEASQSGSLTVHVRPGNHSE